MSADRNGAHLLVAHLEAQRVEYVFGIPGANVDPVFDALVGSKIKTVVCRHEQNATFIAGGLGRLTGKAGVVLVTSGPGCSNLATGLATANTEGDPVVALGGAEQRLAPLAQRNEHWIEPPPTVGQLVDDRGSGRWKLAPLEHASVGKRSQAVAQQLARHAG